MKVDRARFLAMVSLVACCGDPTRERGPVAPPAPTPTVSVGMPPIATATAAPPEVSPPPSSLPACDETADVPACADYGMPGPTCEKGLDPSGECARMRRFLTPRAARAAVQCMDDQAGTCRLHHSSTPESCFRASFSAACEVRDARAACARITAKCGTRLDAEVCVAAVSALQDGDPRSKFVKCMESSCTTSCLGAAEDGASAPASAPATKRTPPSRAADLARYPSRGASLPEEWTTCKLPTDCAAVWISGCSHAYVNQRGAAIVSERVRVDAKGKPDPKSRVISCSGPSAPQCTAGRCVGR
jgi:hypothetical protein